MPSNVAYHPKMWPQNLEATLKMNRDITKAASNVAYLQKTRPLGEKCGLRRPLSRALTLTLTLTMFRQHAANTDKGLTGCNSLYAVTLLTQQNGRGKTLNTIQKISVHALVTGHSGWVLPSISLKVRGRRRYMDSVVLCPLDIHKW